MTEDYGFGSSEYDLLSGDGGSVNLESLKDAVHVVEVFPNKSTDVRVLWYCFEGTVRALVPRFGSFDRYVVDVWESDVGDFIFEHERDIGVHNLLGVRVSHRDRRESVRAERCLERCEVSAPDVEFSLVKGDEEVQRCITCPGSERFGDVLCRVWYGRVAGGDCIQWLEVVYESKGFSVFLEYAEPSGAV